MEGKEEKPQLIGVDEALSLTRAEVRKYYAAHVNPGLATLLSMLDFDKRFVRASGTRVWDAEGNEYLDFLGGFGALNLGHNHPRLIAALEKVAEVPNLLQAGLGAMAAALARNLALITPGRLTRSFFCNSGAEAVEGAIKLARASTGRTKLISCENSFHGKSFGALSLTAREKYQKPFVPLLPDCVTVPYGDLLRLKDELKDGRAAAFIVEPVQGEGGIIVPPKGYLGGARKLCDEYGAKLIVDEVQTGFGRTGWMFACEEEGVTPDILCVAKSLGGGVMPIGAFITDEKTWDSAYGGIERCQIHTSTFGGNTRAAAVAIEAIRILKEEGLAEQAREKGQYLISKLNSIASRYKIIREVRGKGLLVGIEFDKATKGLAEKLTGGVINRLSQEFTASLVAVELLNEHRIITAYTLNNPNVIRLEPPLTVSYEELDRVITALERILEKHRGFASLAFSGVKTAARAIFRHN